MADLEGGLGGVPEGVVGDGVVVKFVCKDGVEQLTVLTYLGYVN